MICKKFLWSTFGVVLVMGFAVGCIPATKIPAPPTAVLAQKNTYCHVYAKTANIHSRFVCHAVSSPNFQDDFDDKSGGWERENWCGMARMKYQDAQLVLTKDAKYRWGNI